ncbi:hypothetical protein HBDW_11420 [Herbaspirillum sp. DW155]|uniref:hypothetical protein n=1 Tax=Herbaspirillum sp. DW155 TaxID=3095609 RepID=UPI00308D9F54|nr:hypothetical protein HBDW_11420 [Herbaspirillum sp. DW155]
MFSLAQRHRSSLAAPAFGLQGCDRPLANTDAPAASTARPQRGLTAASTAAVERSRPVYPWPYIAAWNGKGEQNQAASFVGGPAIDFATPDWADSDFFAPYEAVAQ